MAEIKPFRTVHYNGECVQVLDRLITPPYDIISPEEQEGFYQAHPLNIIRLVLGRQFPDDNATNNRYTRAAETLKTWLDQGVLRHKDKVGLTIYQMEFDQPEGGRRTLDGLVALVKVDDYGKGKVLPHEKTYKGPKQDQLNLIRACRAHLTPIHGLYDDENEQVHDVYAAFMNEPPEQEITDADGTVHRTWTLDDPAAIAQIVGLIADTSVFIADGHHRYETARAYKAEVIESGVSDPEGPHQHVMMYLTSMTHPGLTILPAHRMVKGLSDLDVAGVLDVLDPYFDIEDLCYGENDRYEVAQTLVTRIHSYSEIGGKFGMVVRGDNCFRLLRLKDFKEIDALMDPEIPSSLRGLDVTILREIILGVGLGLDKENSEGQIEYAPLVSDALNKVLRGDVQISFILNPTRVDQVRTAAELGHKLPHKSTYFFPKLSSGLVINVF